MINWHNTNNNLPENNQYVLARIGNRIPFIAKYSLEDKNWHCDYIDLNNNFDKNNNSIVKFKITKWSKINELNLKSIKNELPKHNSHIILHFKNRTPIVARYNEDSKIFYFDLVIGNDDKEVLYTEITIPVLKKINVFWSYIGE